MFASSQLLGRPQIACFLLLFVASTCSAGTWTQWRGPSRDGRVETLPASLDGLQLQWSVDLGPSYSTPVADEKLVFVTESIDEKQEAAIAFDIATGQQVWKTTWDDAMKVPFFAASNGSWIRATPVLSNGRLYVAGMLDVLVCLDAATGDEVWRVDFKERMGTPKPAFGYVSSPLIHDGMVITQAGGGVVAVDAGTGETRWQSMGTEGDMMSGSAFASPAAIVDAPNGPHLLVQTRTTLAGLNPLDGKVYWSTEIEAFRGMNILTPTARVIGNELFVFTSAYGGKSIMFRITGGAGEAKAVWEDKAQGYMSSPVVVGDRIVMHLRNQRVIALDWTTGENIWTSRPYSKYWSMLTDGDSVVALEERGEIHRVNVTGEKMEVVESRKISDSETWAHVAWDGRHMFVRRLDGIDVYIAAGQ